VIFDFASFSFHVPVCGSAAKHATHPRKQNARVDPSVFVFMTPIESRCHFSSILFARLWGPNAASNTVSYAMNYSRSHDAAIRVYDDAGNVIETHEHKGLFGLPIET
jgi:hypothetical protein